MSGLSPTIFQNHLHQSHLEHLLKSWHLAWNAAPWQKACLAQGPGPIPCVWGYIQLSSFQALHGKLGFKQASCKQHSAFPLVWKLHFSLGVEGSLSYRKFSG